MFTQKISFSSFNFKLLKYVGDCSIFELLNISKVFLITRKQFRLELLLYFYLLIGSNIPLNISMTHHYKETLILFIFDHMFLLLWLVKG